MPEFHDLDALTVWIKHEANAKAVQFAEDVVEEIRFIISRHYPPASDPGFPPAYRTGELSAGYKVRRTAFGAAIVSSVPYWVRLEYGDSQLAARPHVRPSLELVRREWGAA